MRVLVRGAITLLAVGAAVAAGGCGGGSTTIINKTVTTQASSTTSTTSASIKVFMMDPGSQRFVAPTEFSFNVDGAVVGKQLHWTDWGAPTATATGTVAERDFPDQAGAEFQSTIKLSQLLACKGAQYYTHATIPVPANAPFKPNVNPLPTPCG